MNQKAHALNQAESGDEKRRWFDRLMKNPTATLILGLAIASGVWKILLPAVGINDLKLGGVSVTDSATQQGVQVSARTIQEMHDALVVLKNTAENQDKRLDRFETKLDRVNDRLDQRLDRHSMGPKRIDWADIDKALDKAAAQGDLVGLNAAESRIR